LGGDRENDHATSRRAVLGAGTINVRAAPLSDHAAGPGHRHLMRGDGAGSPWERWRWFIRFSNRVEVAQLRLFGDSTISVTRRRSVLVLETIGRRSGRRRRTPVTFRRDDDGSYVIGGGAGGLRKVDWVANLRVQQRARVWVKRRAFDVEVRELAGDDYADARKEAERRWPETADYARISGRPVPFFRLTAADQ